MPPLSFPGAALFSPRSGKRFRFWRSQRQGRSGHPAYGQANHAMLMQRFFKHPLALLLALATLALPATARDYALITVDNPTPTRQFFEVTYYRDLVGWSPSIYRFEIAAGQQQALSLDLADTRLLHISVAGQRFDAVMDAKADLLLSLDGENGTVRRIAGNHEALNMALLGLSRWVYPHSEEGVGPYLQSQMEAGLKAEAEALGLAGYLAALKTREAAMGADVASVNTKAWLAQDRELWLRYVGRAKLLPQLQWAAMRPADFNAAERKTLEGIFAEAGKYLALGDEYLYAPEYLNYLRAYAWLGQRLGKEDEVEGLYQSIVAHLQGKARYVLLAELFLEYFQYSYDSQLAVRHYPSFRRDNPYKALNAALLDVYGYELAALEESGGVPNFVGVNTEGADVTLASLQGQVVYVSFWASWCKPCLEGFQKNKDLRDALAAKGVALLNVNLDEAPEKWGQYLAKYPIQGLNIRPNDPASTMRLLDITALPLYHILDKKGHPVFLPDEGSRDVMGFFEALLRD